MKFSELLSQKKEDLLKQVKTLKNDLFELKLQNMSGTLENNAKIRDARRQVARVKTVLTQKLREGLKK